MSPRVRIGLGVLILAVTALVTLVLGAQSIAKGAYTRAEPVEAAAARLAPHFDVRLPVDAETPAPAVLLFSGCGGVRQVQEDYARALNEAGLAAVIVDSFRARGIGRAGARYLVCTGMRLWGQARAADLFAALELAREHPQLDAERLAIAGWSHGGWTILDALTYLAEDAPPPGLSALPENAFSGVRASLLIYPYCSAPVRARTRPLATGREVKALLVSDDLIAPPDDCAALFSREAARGAAIDWEVRDGLTHAFDAPDQPPDPRMRYDAAAAEAVRGAHVERLVEALREPEAPA
jgi:dienelactone hydrolase